jgi:hypothetical protein
MFVFKCKGCGAKLFAKYGESGLSHCEKCDTLTEIPDKCQPTTDDRDFGF